MVKSRLKIIFLMIIYSLIFVGVGYLIGILISHWLGYKFQDVMFVEGILVAIVGLFSMMKGNPSGISMHEIGQNYAQFVGTLNLEVTVHERQSTDYYKNFLKHSVVELAFSGFTIILGGVLIVLFSIFLS